jgi:hypothetical protein
LRAAAAAYQTDQTDFLNLLDSQSVAIDFQHKLFEALENYEKSIADLERAIGTRLPAPSQAMSGANASPVGRSHEEMSGANASPVGRSHQEKRVP